MEYMIMVNGVSLDGTFRKIVDTKIESEYIRDAVCDQLINSMEFEEDIKCFRERGDTMKDAYDNAYHDLAKIIESALNYNDEDFEYGGVSFWFCWN